jgi:hypothetical protein
MADLPITAPLVILAIDQQNAAWEGSRFISGGDVLGFTACRRSLFQQASEVAKTHSYQLPLWRAGLGVLDQRHSGQTSLAQIHPPKRGTNAVLEP